MNLLALETSGAACSTALLTGERITQRHEEAPRRHADLILGMLDELLADARLRLADLDAVVYGRGPGSFTGVRIAAAVAQGIAFGAGCGVVGISTLAATAEAARRSTDTRALRLACALDARMGEVYWGCFCFDPDHSRIRTNGDERVIAPDHTPLLDGRGWRAVGSGWSAYPELIERHEARLAGVEPEVRAEAQDLASLARRELETAVPSDPMSALPIYLRDQVADKARPV